MDCSPQGSFVHGIFQARVLEWVAIAFSMTSLGAVKTRVLLNICNEKKANIDEQKLKMEVPVKKKRNHDLLSSSPASVSFQTQNSLIKEMSMSPKLATPQ